VRHNKNGKEVDVEAKVVKDAQPVQAMGDETCLAVDLGEMATQVEPPVDEKSEILV
jgi:hypothetical protein